MSLFAVCLWWRESPVAFCRMQVGVCVVRGMSLVVSHGVSYRAVMRRGHHDGLCSDVVLRIARIVRHCVM